MSAKRLSADAALVESLPGPGSGWATLSQIAAPGSRTSSLNGHPAHAADASGFAAELASVQAELERVRRQAETSAGASYKSGFDDGFRQGLAKNQLELDAYRTQIAEALRNADAARRELLEQSDADLVKLSIAIAEKILNRQIQLDPEALQGLARSALDRLAGKAVQCVRIHPEDRPVIEQALAQAGSRRSIRVEADPALDRGSLLFDTEYGSLDASIATQLEEIESGLVDRLRRSGV